MHHSPETRCASHRGDNLQGVHHSPCITLRKPGVHPIAETISKVCITLRVSLSGNQMCIPSWRQSPRCVSLSVYHSPETRCASHRGDNLQGVYHSPCITLRKPGVHSIAETISKVCITLRKPSVHPIAGTISKVCITPLSQSPRCA